MEARNLLAAQTIHLRSYFCKQANSSLNDTKSGLLEPKDFRETKRFEQQVICSILNYVLKPHLTQSH
jgi:hypothetical protein